jgi:hypothetical protein
MQLPTVGRAASELQWVALVPISVSDLKLVQQMYWGLEAGGAHMGR